jgi:FAD-dependent oxidoreductase family protein
MAAQKETPAMPRTSAAFETILHEADFCVVGGGMAGLCAAVAAARHGAKTVLMQDRPVLGGNASSEIRMHVCGADRHGGIAHLRETGLLEEMRLDNARRNPQRSYSIWDTILYEKAQYQDNLTLLLNCSCLDASVARGRIRSVTGWQLTTQKRHEIRAALFADCSGDAVLAPLTGAEFRVGREARREYGESIAPVRADKRTMGMTCLFHARRHAKAQPFEPPAWAHRYDKCTDLPYGKGGHSWLEMGYWWLELGGEYDSIGDTERLRDELLRIVYGVWDHIKNHCPDRDKAKNWALEWVQFLPGKRESRRYVGDHVMNQNDVEAEGRFDDIVAYGGWSMDDHHPAGFRANTLSKPATIFHPAPAPYGIPYRCLYSRNVRNLFFAGRCHSATHAAMSSTRVMGTCAVMGQAIGTAAAMAARRGVDPRGLTSHIGELQQTLLRDDCYLPWVLQEMPKVTKSATLTASRGDPEPLRDGIARQVGEETHCWTHRRGDWVTIELDRARKIRAATLVCDSAMERNLQLTYHGAHKAVDEVPKTLQKSFRLEARIAGRWRTLHKVTDNHQRWVQLKIGRKVQAVRWTAGETWGAPRSRLYAFYVE